MARCFCCRLEVPCDCGREPCWECGACGFHCSCPQGFVTCECRRIDVDLDDARDCPVHGGRRTARFRTSRHCGHRLAAGAVVSNRAPHWRHWRGTFSIWNIESSHSVKIQMKSGGPVTENGR